MANEKLIVVMNPATKREFMKQCENRALTASAVVRHLLDIQLEAWRKDPECHKSVIRNL